PAPPPTGMPVYVLMVWNAGCAFWDCVFCLTLFRCASANGIAHTATSESRINALQSRCALIEGLICFFISLALVIFEVEAGLLNCINCNPVPRGTRNHPHEALWNSGLTSADSGLQLDLGDRAKRCLSEDSAPATYSAVPKIR